MFRVDEYSYKTHLSGLKEKEQKKKQKQLCWQKIDVRRKEYVELNLRSK